MCTQIDSWPPELRRAMMSAWPDFFAWPADERLRYRVTLPDGVREAVVAALLREHGERRPVAVARLESHGRVPLALQHRINEWLQPLVGIGADAFTLNESFSEVRSILDFETLLDYDLDHHAFQQDANVREFAGYEREPYAGSLHCTWARAFVDGHLCYLTLSMASWHLHGSMEDAANMEIDARVPHRHVRGPEDGKRDERGMIRWDMHVDASGQEALLDELRHRVWGEQQRRRRALAEEFAARRLGGCYLDDAPWEGAPPDERNRLIVFTDPDALASVHLATLLRDCRRIERPLAELEAWQAKEAERMRAFVAEQHDDLVKNFDPKVVRLRKKLKVMMHPDAVRDLGADGST